MVDTAQIVLLFIITVLTILLTALGIQVFFILRELKKTVQKANKVLDDAGAISASVSSPLSSIFSLAEGLKLGSIAARFFKRKSKKSKNGDGDEDE